MKEYGFNGILDAEGVFTEWSRMSDEQLRKSVSEKSDWSIKFYGLMSRTPVIIDTQLGITVLQQKWIMANMDGMDDNQAEFWDKMLYKDFVKVVDKKFTEKIRGAYKLHDTIYCGEKSANSIFEYLVSEGYIVNMTTVKIVIETHRKSTKMKRIEIYEEMTQQEYDADIEKLKSNIALEEGHII